MNFMTTVKYSIAEMTLIHNNRLIHWLLFGAVTDLYFWANQAHYDDWHINSLCKHDGQFIEIGTIFSHLIAHPHLKAHHYLHPHFS